MRVREESDALSIQIVCRAKHIEGNIICQSYRQLAQLPIPPSPCASADDIALTTPVAKHFEERSFPAAPLFLSSLNSVVSPNNHFAFNARCCPSAELRRWQRKRASRASRIRMIVGDSQLCLMPIIGTALMQLNSVAVGVSLQRIFSQVYVAQCLASYRWIRQVPL
jgi:hypothetical protein